MGLFFNKKKNEISEASFQGEEEKKIEDRFYFKFKKDYEELKKIFFEIKRVEGQLNLPILKKNMDLQAGKDINPDFKKKYLKETEELLEEVYKKIDKTHILKDIKKFVKELKKLKKERKEFYNKNNFDAKKIERFYDRKIKNLEKVKKTCEKLTKKIKNVTNNNFVKIVAILNIVARMLYMTSLSIYLMKERELQIKEGIAIIENESFFAKEDIERMSESEDNLEAHELQEIVNMSDRAVSACT